MKSAITAQDNQATRSGVTALVKIVFDLGLICHFWRHFKYKFFNISFNKLYDLRNPQMN